MPLTPWVPAITQLADGDDVSAEAVNPILAQFTQRTQYLYETFNDFGDKSVLIAYGLPILQGDSAPTVGDFACYINTVGGTGLAVTQISFLPDPSNQVTYMPSNSTYPIGLVKDISGDNTTADVYLSGVVTLEYDIDDPTYGLIQTGESNNSDPFYPGPYFLSKDYAGKITKYPIGIAVYAGYALDRRTFALAPNVNEFSQLFTTYRYDIIDRPCGIPVLSTGIWSIGNPDTSKVGWVPVTSLSSGVQALAPAGAQFYYNLPNGVIADDTGINLYEQVEQTSLSRILSFVDPNLTLLTVNGINQALNTTNDVNGVYTVNDIGLWWFSNVDGQQPWSSDIPGKVTITANTGTQQIALTAHGLSVGDVVQFTTTGSLPSPLTISTNYYVVVINDANHFQVSTTLGGSAVTLTTTGSGTNSIPQPYIWKSFPGTDEFRPKISLQFIKFNPDFKLSFVSSLKSFNPNSSALQFWTADKTAVSSTGKGDLLARLLLNFNNTTATNAATALSTLSYSETTGIITCAQTPVISQLTQGNGISITPTITGGVTVPGSYVLSASAGTSSGQVTSLEPSGCELLYTGLHSYISMSTPDIVPSSIIGKITLQSTVPSSDMSFVMWFIGSTNAVTTQNIDFNFSYSVSRPGYIIDTSMTTQDVTFSMPNPYTANTVFALSIPNMIIPASAFAGGNCSVNFQLSRLTSDSNPYTASLGLVDMYWTTG